MLQDNLKRHVEITAEELPETGGNRTEAIKEAAARAADEAQKAIKDLRAKRELLKRNMLPEAKDVTHAINRVTVNVTENIEEFAE